MSTGNCTADFDTMLAYHQKSKKKSSSKEILIESEQESIDVDEMDYMECLKENAIGMNAITYVAGYLLKKSLQKHSCEVCRKELVKNQLTDSSQLLCMFKAFSETTEKPFGGLLCPNKQFLEYITEIEATFVQQFEQNISMIDVGKYLLSILPQFNAIQCPCFPSTYLLKLFIRMHIHYALKFGNRELCSTKKRNRKFLKVSHL
jgi:hypothetical protein